MPYRWTPAHTSLKTSKDPDGEGPLMRLDIWPHRSLPTKGFVAAIWLMFAAGTVPLLAFIGTSAFWVLLLCLMATLAALWHGLRRSDRVHLREEFLFWSDRVQLTHWDIKNTPHEWRANPHWVRMKMHKTSGPVEHYITLNDVGPTQNKQPARIVELGAFLAPEERIALQSDLEAVLSQLR